MTQLNIEIKQLKSDIINMWGLVCNQLFKTEKSLAESDINLALDVISQEKRVDAFELKINRDCENMLALYHPVAIDLRFILAAMKITYNLERIGDYTKSIAKLISSAEEPFDEDSVKEAQISPMFSVAYTMLIDALKAFKNEEIGSLYRIFEKDLFLNEVNRKSNIIIGSIIQRNPLTIEKALNLLSITRKLERVGDQAKSISEEIIFYREACILRHKKVLITGIIQ